MGDEHAIPHHPKRPPRLPEDVADAISRALEPGGRLGWVIDRYWGEAMAAAIRRHCLRQGTDG